LPHNLAQFEFLLLSARYPSLTHFFSVGLTSENIAITRMVAKSGAISYILADGMGITSTTVT